MACNPTTPSNSEHYSRSRANDCDNDDFAARSRSSGTVVIDCDTDPDHRHKPDSLDRVDQSKVHLFHDSKVIPTTVDMTETTEQEARQLFDAEPCSHCFRDIDKPMTRVPGERV